MWCVRSRELSIPVRLTMTASGLFSQIILAYFRATGSNSSGDTTAFTIPHSCILCGEMGFPSSANSDARCRPSVSRSEKGIPRNRTILPNAPALANTPRFTSGSANDAFVLAMTRSLNQSIRKHANQFTTISNPPPDVNSGQTRQTKCIAIDSSNNRLLPSPSGYSTKPIN